MGPWSVISGITTVAMLPPAVDADTRRQAIRALKGLAAVEPTIARAIRRAHESSAARGKLEAVVIAMGRTLLAAREVR